MNETGFISRIGRIFFKTVGDVLAILQAMSKVLVFLLFFYIVYNILGQLINFVLVAFEIHMSRWLVWVLIGLLLYASAWVAVYAVDKLPVWEWKKRFLRSKKLICANDIEEFVHRMTDMGGAEYAENFIAWVLALVFVVSFSGLALETFVLDTFLTHYFMNGLTALGHVLSRATGVHYHLVAVGSLYILDALCLASFLVLLVPVLRHKGGQASRVYRLSCVSGILSYAFGFVVSNLRFFVDLAWCSGVTSQYHLLHTLVMHGDSCMAYNLMHAYILPPSVALLLNLVLLVVLFRNNRKKKVDAKIEAVENYLQEVKAGENEETLDTGQPKISRETVESDAMWFSFLMESYISKNGTDNSRLLPLLYGYCPKLVAEMTDADVDEVLNSGYANRSRKRIEVVIENARIFYGLTVEFGSFRNYVVSITHLDGTRGLSLDEVNVAAMIVANDMRNKGFKQIGPVTAVNLISEMFNAPIPRDHFCNTSNFFKRHR